MVTFAFLVGMHWQQLTEFKLDWLTNDQQMKIFTCQVNRLRYSQAHTLEHKRVLCVVVFYR